MEQDGKVWQVKEVADGATFANNMSNPAKVASIGKIKKLIIAEGIERLGRLMGNDGTNPASRGNADTLKEVVLPSTLISIDEDAFKNCPKIELGLPGEV